MRKVEFRFFLYTLRDMASRKKTPPKRPVQHNQISYEDDTQGFIASFSEETGKQYSNSITGNVGEISDCPPKEEKMAIYDVDINVHQLHNLIRVQYHFLRGSVDQVVEIRRILPTENAMFSHPVRRETPPDRIVFSLFAKRDIPKLELIGVLCGEVCKAKDLEKVGAHPFIFSLASKSLLLDCRTFCNELAFIQPPEGWDDNMDMVKESTNCHFVSCFVQGLPSLALIALKSIKAKDELLAPRDSNYWTYTNRSTVDDLSLYIRQTLPLFRQLEMKLLLPTEKRNHDCLTQDASDAQPDPAKRICNTVVPIATTLLPK